MIAAIFFISSNAEVFAENSEDYLVYDASSKGLMFEYHNSWIINDEYTSDTTLASLYLTDDSDIILANLIVTHSPLPEPIMPLDLANAVIDEFERNLPDMRIEQEGNITVDGYKSRQNIISYDSEVGQTKQDMIIIVAENNAYSFTFNALQSDFNQYHPLFIDTINSIEITPETIPRLISNVYEESGISATFPENWLTIKSKVNDIETDLSMDMVVSFPPSVANGGIENAVFVALGYSDHDPLGNNSYFKSIESSGCYFTTDNISIVNLNNMKAMEFEMNCIPDGFDEEIESVGYALISEDRTLLLFYMASEQVYDANIQKFDEFKNTVNIKNTLDLSDYAKVASVYGMTIKQEQIAITNEVTLPVILYDDSMIKDFNFDVENSQIFFQPILNDDEYFQIDLEIDGLLEPPYQVDINGEYADFFIVDDNTNNKTTISVFAESPTDQVTIKGKLVESLTPNLPTSNSNPVPSWIKSNAEFWAQDKIDDATFISGIQFLIKEGILDVPSSTETIQDSSEGIPSWIKGNAEFWAQGLISDDDFLNGIQYLVAKGIIQV